MAKMKKVRIVATLGTPEVDLDGNKLSDAVLRHIAETAVGTPVLESFEDDPSDALATILSAWMSDEDNVVATFDLPSNVAPTNAKQGGK